MKIKCNVCGKTFRPGNNPVSGVPNGLGFAFGTDEVFNVCAFCISYRQVKALAMAEEFKRRVEGEDTEA